MLARVLLALVVAAAPASVGAADLADAVEESADAVGVMMTPAAEPEQAQEEETWHAPRAIVTSPGGDSVQDWAWSQCWPQPDTPPSCGDSAGDLPSDALRIRAGQRARITFAEYSPAGHDPPRRVSAVIAHIDEGRIGDQVSSERLRLDSLAARMPVAPGRYILAIDADWSGSASASYYFALQVSGGGRLPLTGVPVSGLGWMLLGVAGAMAAMTARRSP